MAPCTTAQHITNQNRVWNDIYTSVARAHTHTQVMGYNLGSKGRNRVPDQAVTLRASRGVGSKVKRRGREEKRKKGKAEEDTIHGGGGYNSEADVG